MPVAACCRMVVGGAGWAVAPPSLVNFWGASYPLRSKIGGGASDPPSNLICGVLVIPKQIFWRGLLWSLAFKC